MDDGELDRILKKVFDGGVHTLTEQEKDALKNATVRQQEAARARRSDL